MGKMLKYSVTYEVAKDFLVDEDTLKSDFNNSWQLYLDWLFKEEAAEVITGFGAYPIDVKVES